MSEYWEIVHVWIMVIELEYHICVYIYMYRCIDLLGMADPKLARDVDVVARCGD